MFKRNVLNNLCALIFSIYTTFLFYDFFNLRIRMLLLIILISFVIFKLIFGRALKKDRKETVISLFVACVITVVFSNFFVFSLKPTQITITPLDSKKSNVVIMSYLEVNHQVVDLKKYDIADGWYHSYNLIVSNDKTSHPLVINVDKCFNCKMVFEKRSCSDRVKITWGQNNTEEINLYSKGESSIVKEISPIECQYFQSTIKGIASVIYLSFIIICFWNYFISFSIDKRKVIIMFVAILVVRFLYYSKVNLLYMYPDSFTYTYSTLKEIFTSLDVRTPVYRFIVAFNGIIFGESFKLIITIIEQIVSSVVSILFFYKILKKLFSNNAIIFIFTIVYGINPALMGFDCVILTESFAISWFVVLLYFLISYIKEERIEYGIMSVFLAFLLTFLRPSSQIYMYCILLFLLIKAVIFRMKNDFKCLLFSLLTVVLMLGYSFAFQQKYTLFSISDPMPRQLLYVVMEQKLYIDSKDQIFVNRIEESLENRNNEMSWDAMIDVMQYYTLNEVQEKSIQCIKNNPTKYIKYQIKLTKQLFFERFTGYNQYLINNNNGLVNILDILNIYTIGSVYVIMLIELIIVCYYWIKKKNSWIHLGFFGFLIGTVLTTVIGTNAEFPRTMILVLPIEIICISIYLNILIKNIH